MTAAVGRGLSSLIPSAAQRRSTVPAPASGEGASILLIPTAQIAPNPHQPRRTIDHASLEDLIGSIREHGILQPLVVIKADRGYQLIAGERRLRAAQILGLRTVPAMLRDATTQQQLELAIVENVQRQDLNPMERARAYRKLTEEFGLTQEQVARRVGKSRAAVANALRLLELPDEIQRAVADGQVSEGHAKVILGRPTPKEQLAIFRKILAGALSVRSGEQLVRRTGRGRRTRGPADPVHIALEEELRDRFGTRVRIDRKGQRGSITIEFYSDEELRGIVARLRKA